ncbi:hypothetical protein BDZ94DRAFT_1268459 [Collybia nuda]|uniref:Uncharacterized protein n=1 Tax=Collybia nuda TaxID=64659 RepID=A0A9P6CEN7_9AGAR|nr:hypothetical protein BDZ94DRAFT_1268459 [Collybia nuda]
MSTKFSPTPAELALVSQIFVHSDPQKHGILTGDVAVRVFGGANLKPTVLGEIWSIADEDNNGFLPRKGVAIAIRLMGWAQKGEKITPALVNKPGPLPTIEGITVITQQNTGLSSPRSPPPGLPSFTPQDKAKFQALFMKSGPTNGLLSGEKSRDFFVKSGLSNEKLLQIWNLADTQDRGALDSTDFAIGMYFIQGLMSGQLSFIPTSLPPGLYQQAGGNPSSNHGSVRSHMTGQSGSFSPMAAVFPQSQNRGNVQPQYTGQAQLQSEYTGFSNTQPKPPVLPARPATSGLNSSPFTAQRNGHVPQWDVTPAEKANSDRFFDDLDTQQRGFIEGEVAVPFMLKSNLPGEVLAQVWDLADINNDGRLTRDGFAVAMYLIQKILAGNEMPSTLPPSLVPPSMRANATSPFSPVTQQAVPETPKDLLWDDIPPTTTVPSHQTGPTPSTFPLASTSSSQTRDPFSSTTFSPTSHQDLLGDDDDISRSSPPLHDQSAEIGNAQNQLNSTNRSLDAAKQERLAIEQTLANQASQLSALQTQLSSAKAAYETETKLLATLKDRHSGQIADMQKSREELIRAESDLSAVRVEKSEIEGAFLRDKEEARELHRRMVETNQHVETLKLEVEKAKKDAKQQKGLLAIARKQLSTKEAEKAKVEKELEETNIEVASVVKDKDIAETELTQLSTNHLTTVKDLDKDLDQGLSSDPLTFAADQPLPSSPDPSTPAGSSKSNNPFDRLTKSPGQSPPLFQSPFLPFSGASVPTPSTNGTTTDTSSNALVFDPFGFSQAFDTDRPLQDSLPNASPIISTSRTSTPKPVDIDTSKTLHTPSPSSPGENDHFVTPPMTANIRTPQFSPSPPNLVGAVAAAEFPALDDAASHFPDIEGEISNNQSSTAHTETDLNAELKELDIDDSDSDIDSDGEVPLADLVKGKGKVVESQPANIPTTENAEAPNLSFDNIFGVTSPTGGVVSSEPFSDNGDLGIITATTSQNKSSGVSTTSTITSEARTPSIAGVNTFDEAMGLIPSSTAPNNAQHFTFDSGFEDNFDFASATETSFPPAPAITNTGGKNNGFDGVFETPPRNGASVIPVGAFQGESPRSEVPVKSEPPKPTFEEAFSGFDSEPILNLQGSFSLPTKQEIPNNHSSTNSPTQTTSPLPAGSVSPKIEPASPRAVPPRPASPSPRAKSPPPRMASPKPRLSNSSSKDTPEKTEEPAARRSKLSIRLPFGKKKKQQHQEPLPIPPSHLLTPTVEEIRSISPAVDDDVEAVKQLTAMGFSRTQAVNALEKYGYDVQKALNSLLGAP